MSDRRDLRFAESVDKCFRYLLERGFVRVACEPTFVRFESRHIFLNVYHGRQSYEIGLELGEMGVGGRDASYSMSELMRLCCSKEAAGYRDFAARSPDGVAEGVRRLALRFRRCIESGALTTADLFVRLQGIREKRTQEYAAELNLKRARQVLETAWRERDYPNSTVRERDGRWRSGGSMRDARS